jgi:hypothetical protein
MTVYKMTADKMKGRQNDFLKRTVCKITVYKMTVDKMEEDIMTP